MLERLISYPLFRLTLALGAGIILADSFMPDATSLPWLTAAEGALVLLLVVCLRSFRYAHRMWYGFVAYLAFALLGAILLLAGREDVRYGWLPGEAIYVGRVMDVPHRKPKTMQAVVEVEQMRLPADSSWHPVNREIMLYWMPDSTQGTLACGDRLCFRASISRPASERDFSGFDYGLYLERQGISGTAIAYGGNWQKLAACETLPFRQEALLFREKILSHYRSWGLDGDTYAVVSALTVGDKSELTRELKDSYTAAGTSHILALSGLHVVILVMILSWMLYPLRYLPGGKWLTSFLLVAILWGFAFLSGLSPSVIRAVVMYSLYVVASVFTEDRFSGIFAVSLAAFLMLVYNPLYLFDVSFQLSFVAVLSILVVYPMFERLLCFRFKPLDWLWKTLALSASAQLGTLPFICYYFGTFPTYFLLANLVVTPMSVCILAFALLALPFGGAALFVQGLSYSVSFLNGTMEWVQHLSGSQITSIYFSLFQAWLCGICLCAFVGYGAKRSAHKLIVALCMLCVLSASFVYERLKPVEDKLCFARAGVYTQRERNVSQLVSATNIYQIRQLRIALADDGRWANKVIKERIPLDYLYICRGFKGTMQGMSEVFRIKQVVFDGSLNEAFRKKLEQECESLGISYVDISEKGTFSVSI